MSMPTELINMASSHNDKCLIQQKGIFLTFRANRTHKYLFLHDMSVTKSASILTTNVFKENNILGILICDRVEQYSIRSNRETALFCDNCWYI